jgi:hypothetical protein
MKHTTCELQQAIVAFDFDALTEPGAKLAREKIGQWVPVAG